MARLPGTKLAPALLCPFIICPISKCQRSWSMHDGYNLQVSPTSLISISLLGAEGGWRWRSLPSHPPHGILHLEQAHNCYKLAYVSAHRSPVLNPYQVGKARHPKVLRAPCKSREHTQKANPLMPKNTGLRSSLLLFARHDPMCIGQGFWDRHPLDPSAHALPQGHHLAPHLQLWPP